jgi:chemotaxis protein MotB
LTFPAIFLAFVESTQLNLKGIAMSYVRTGCAVLIGLMCIGCQSKMAQENRALHAQNRELQAMRNQDQAKLAAAPTPEELEALRQQAAAKDAEIARLEASLRQPTAGNDPTGLGGIDATYDPREGTITVNLPGDVLFDAGKATLRTSAKGTLDKIVAAIKKDYANKTIYVDGHTDTDPIKRTAGQWEDNLDLSGARAMAVERHLVAAGIPSKNVVVRAYGPDQPKATKPASRRVEIVVMTK